MNKWKCVVCGEIVKSENAPQKCPACGVSSEYFEKIKEETHSTAANTKENIVIIGASAAGMSAAAEIRKLHKESDITILSKEDTKGYFRPMVSKLLSNNKVTKESMAIKKDKWFEENNIKLLLNKVVSSVDTNNKKVILQDGEVFDYTKLIIASGAEVFVPPIAGKDKKGVFTLRYIKDSNDIKAYSTGKKTAAVIGGGVLGLEAASELNNLGLKVSVIEKADRILPRQLDEEASVVLEEIVKNSGVIFKKNVGTKEIVGDDEAKGILLDNGEVVDAEVVIISTGVKANTEIVDGTGIEMKRAIVVDEKMQTSIKDVYACGDCAEFEGINYALWSEAVEQGKAAGINVCGGDYSYKTITPSTTLNSFNTSVFSIGDVGSNPDIKYNVYFENKDNKFTKLFFIDKVLCGAILIGDTSKTRLLMKSLENKETMEDVLLKLN